MGTRASKDPFFSKNPQINEGEVFLSQPSQPTSPCHSSLRTLPISTSSIQPGSISGLLSDGSLSIPPPEVPDADSQEANAMMLDPPIPAERASYTS